MQKLISILVATIFAGVTMSAFAAEEKKAEGKKDEKKMEKKADKKGDKKPAAKKEEAKK